MSGYLCPIASVNIWSPPFFPFIFSFFFSIHVMGHCVVDERAAPYIAGQGTRTTCGKGVLRCRYSTDFLTWMPPSDLFLYLLISSNLKVLFTALENRID